MSDMLGISSNAVGAYQRALSTVSNNIANVNTEGYSRQDVVLKDTAPAKSANMFFGTGVALQNVKRQFDAFAESNLRNSTSDLATQKPMVDYTKRVMDIMGDKSVGLSSALDAFFASAGALSADPASTVLRTSFLRNAEGVGSRFAELSGQLDLIGTETRQALESATGKVNTLTSQLALINQQLAKSPTVEGQPAELMDRRDLALRQLSEIARIKTSFSTNGTVTVSLGSTITQSVVVNGQKSRPIGVDNSVKDKLELVIDPYGNTESLASASGGEIGGLQTFISQVLDPAQKSLNFLANTLVTEANNIQSNGIDAYGEVGQNLFAIDPTVANEAGGVHVVLNDGMRVATAAQFRVSENANNTSTVRSSVMYAKSPLPVGIGNTNLVNNPNPTAGVSIKVDGSKVYSPVSTMAAGMKATFYLDNAAPGQQLQVLTRDGRQLLGQSLTETEKFQMLTPANGFVADATYSDAYLNKVGDYSYRDMNVFYGAKAQVLYTQAFDKNLDETARLPEPAVLETGRIVPSVVAQGTNLIDAGAITINGISMGDLRLQDQTVASGTLKPSDVAAWVNSKSTDTGVRAEVFNEVRVSVSDLDFNKPLKLNGQTIPPFSDLKSLVSSINNTSSAGVLATVNDNGELVLSPLTAGADITVGPADDGGKPNNVLNVRASTYAGQVRLVQIADELHVSSGGIDFTKPLMVNGRSILPQQGVTTAALLKDAINTAAVGVQASIDANGVLVMKTTSDAPITIGPAKAADGTYQTNALGLEPMAYTVEERMKRLLVEDPTKSEIRISFGKYGNPEKIGTPADLAKIGIRTGAYIDGGTKDDLLVFVTGQGSATVAASYQGAPTDPRDSLRQQSLVVKFTAADRFTITDAATGTELANRHYDPSVLEPVIDYQGLQIKFTHAPGVGDSYQIDGNQDGLGNNVNMLVMADLAKKEVVNGKTLNNSYIDQINSVGNLAQQASITQQALTVVNDQAIASRDKVSGVNLDDEAAALIRYQQAYQAAAKALQVSGQLFDSIVQIR